MWRNLGRILSTPGPTSEPGFSQSCNNPHIGLPRFPLLKNKLYCRGQLISHYLFLRTYIATCAISPLVPAIWCLSKYWRLIKGIGGAIFLLSSNLLSCPTHISYRSMRYGSHSSLTYNLKRKMLSQSSGESLNIDSTSFPGIETSRREGSLRNEVHSVCKVESDLRYWLFSTRVTSQGS